MKSLQILLSLIIAMSLMTMGQAEEASMAKRGNVRFGPSTKDVVVCTLNPGDAIDIIGAVEGESGWYKIKFPSQGHAWMHSLNLAKTEQENIMRVTTDGAVVRQDATRGGSVVMELKMNDTVQWKGPMVGQWYAVYVPDAVAYIHSSVLFIKTPAVDNNNGNAQEAGNANRPETKPEPETDTYANHPTDKLWREAKATYESYYQQLQQDSSKALQLNWSALSDKLSKVIQDHPDLRTRIYAKRLFNGIQRVVSSAGMEAAPEIAEVSKVGTQEDTIALNLDEEVKPEVKPKVDETPKPDIAVINKTDKGVVGWLQDLEVSSIGVNYVILGDNGISAFIKLKEGLTINLKELHWQRVHVDGETQIVDHEVPAQYKGIPLIIVSELKVVK